MNDHVDELINMTKHCNLGHEYIRPRVRPKKTKTLPKVPDKDYVENKMPDSTIRSILLNIYSSSIDA